MNINHFCRVKSSYNHLITRIEKDEKENNAQKNFRYKTEQQGR
jgi:hypothetical protein